MTPLWYIQLVVSKYISEYYNGLMARKEGEDNILDTIQDFLYELGMKPLVMSSSWNFSAQASPSCEDSEPSWAELGHFNFWAETELIFF